MLAILCNLAIGTRVLEKPPHGLGGNLGTFFQVFRLVKSDTPLGYTAIHELGVLYENSSLLRGCCNVALLPVATPR